MRYIALSIQNHNLIIHFTILFFNGGGNVSMNRFPKMVVLQYARALRLGYNVNLAKAFGYAITQKYAIFKNIPKTKKTREHQNSKHIKRISKKRQIENAIYTKDDIFKITTDFDGYPVIGGNKITEKDFDKYMSRFNQETLDKFGRWAGMIISKCDKNVLKNESRFFNQVWKNHRDDLI